ncbi:MAG: nucleotidyltransferase domain-containing protein [Candidatus Korobacteraceae bacterium]|jgi:predicted nucleotidyltransferase
MKHQLDEFVERLKAAAGPNLDALVLYGSAAGDDYHEHYSDVNLLCLLHDAGGPALKQLAPVFEWWSKKLRHRLPLCMTTEELRTSADVFAIETLDLKHKHRILAGRDFLAEIEVPMNLHRVQLEHELRSLLLKLRQHYLLAPTEEELKKAVAKSISTVVTLLRHALIAVDRHVPAQKRAVITTAGEAFGVDISAFQTALELREGHAAKLEIGPLYQAYLEAVEAITHCVDQLASNGLPK